MAERPRRVKTCPVTAITSCVHDSAFSSRETTVNSSSCPSCPSWSAAARFVRSPWFRFINCCYVGVFLVTTSTSVVIFRLQGGKKRENEVLRVGRGEWLKGVGEVLRNGRV